MHVRARVRVHIHTCIHTHVMNTLCTHTHSHARGHAGTRARGHARHARTRAHTPVLGGVIAHEKNPLAPSAELRQRFRHPWHRLLP